LTDPGPLSAFQQEVASIIFELPASEGFLLAGGAALVANRLTTRPTQDLDFFRSTSTVTAARDGLEQAAAVRGWAVQRIRDEATFVRLLIEGPDTVLVDLCLDSAPIRPPVETPLGPTFAPDELAARKVIALFDRAEARDFADLVSLLSRFPKDVLLRLANEIDPGFDLATFGQMLRTVGRHDDAQLVSGGTPAGEVRAACLDWANEITSELE
jgi:predicted nucleotidyltransferase component of viral defense system